jgi:hypothetical protein
MATPMRKMEGGSGPFLFQEHMPFQAFLDTLATFDAAISDDISCHITSRPDHEQGPKTSQISLEVR